MKKNFHLLLCVFGFFQLNAQITVDSLVVTNYVTELSCPADSSCTQGLFNVYLDSNSTKINISGVNFTSSANTNMHTVPVSCISSTLTDTVVIEVINAVNDTTFYKFIYRDLVCPCVLGDTSRATFTKDTGLSKIYVDYDSVTVIAYDAIDTTTYPGNTPEGIIQIHSSYVTGNPSVQFHYELQNLLFPSYFTTSDSAVVDSLFFGSYDIKIYYLDTVTLCSLKDTSKTCQYCPPSSSNNCFSFLPTPMLKTNPMDNCKPMDDEISAIAYGADTSSVSIGTFNFNPAWPGNETVTGVSSFLGTACGKNYYGTTYTSSSHLVGHTFPPFTNVMTTFTTNNMTASNQDLFFQSTSVATISSDSANLNCCNGSITISVNSDIWNPTVYLLDSNSNVIQSVPYSGSLTITFDSLCKGNYQINASPFLCNPFTFNIKEKDEACDSSTTTIHENTIKSLNTYVNGNDLFINAVFLDNTTPVYVEIIDINGKIILKDGLILNSNKLSKKYYLDEANGFYILKLYHNNMISSKKILLAR